MDFRSTPITGHAVAIAGGGPTGLMLAGELALAGVDVAIIEQRASQNLMGVRARSAFRSIEILDQRGIAGRFLLQGRLHKCVHFRVPLDVSDLPTRHNYVLGLGQIHVERLLAAWAGEFGARIYRKREVIGFAQDDAGVEIELSGGNSLRAQYLVGCDGGRSVIRKAAGIAFPGCDPETSWLIAEAEMSEEPDWGFRHDAMGTHAISKLGDGRKVGVVVVEQELAAERGEPTLRDASEALIAVYRAV